MTCRVTMPPDLSCVMQLLPEHIGSDQGQAGIGDTEPAFTVVIVIFADNRTVLDLGAGIDDAAVDATILADPCVRQQDGVRDAAV